MKDRRIDCFINQLKKYDIGTYQHSLNVVSLIGRMFEYSTIQKLFSPEEQQNILRGALLHDIGKLRVDVAILNKKDPLTNIEFSMIKEHPTKGYEIAKEQGFSEMVCNIIYEHHERRDGSGYPNRKRNFSKAVELVYIADIYCAMTENRAYRNPTTEKETINMMYYDVEAGNISKIFYEILKSCVRTEVIQCG